MSQSPQSTQAFLFVRAVVLVVLGQAVALLVSAVLTIMGSGTGQLPVSAIIFLVFLYLLGTVWLIAAAVGVNKGKAWPRGALIVAELLAVIVSFTYFQLGDILLGGALIISGGVVLILLFTPALNNHLVQRRSRE
ncbi:MAG TPA: hypothetical protein K8V32_06480 [Enteractinococcus helveticum]|uniref:Uncharacterized protein n=1 Tax=Enteractinococcus helveticum TaxID=1837282 RepID=A0A921FMB6_9MICC|nr:hypothetical protein [Enteractinococcus helveticum]HJF14440.1 hypothetical protein [Enteractinococcus helveticum]